MVDEEDISEDTELELKLELDVVTEDEAEELNKINELSGPILVVPMWELVDIKELVTTDDESELILIELVVDVGASELPLEVAAVDDANELVEISKLEVDQIEVNTLDVSVDKTSEDEPTIELEESLELNELINHSMMKLKTELMKRLMKHLIFQ